MPVVPQPDSNGIVKSLGFSFNFSNAFASTAQAQGVPVNTSFATLQASLGSSNDLFPAQQTAWGRANQAYAEGGSGGLPAGTVPGTWLSYNGTDWIEGGASGNVKLGYNAGLEGQEEVCIAIGENAGRTGQQANGIAIGFNAGMSNQGSYCIAIGNNTGETNQPPNTIILNASGGALNAGQPGGMYVNPIRNDNSNPNWLTYNSMSGEITFDTLLASSLGTSNDVPSFSNSVWAYAKQANETGLAARDEASNALTWQTNYTKANAVGVAGTSGDTASLTTSLWAYAKQAEVDAQSALTKTSFSNCDFTGIFTPSIRALDGNSTILLPNIGIDGVNTLQITTFANAITIRAGESTGGGTLRPVTVTGSDLLIGINNDYGTAGQVLGSDGTGKTVWQTPTPSSMTWDFEGTGLGHTTSLILAPPYSWTTAFQHIWTMTATIPANWQGRANTFISLFIWNTFATATTTFNYYDYSINGSIPAPLGKTSATRSFTNGGVNQLIPITGNLTNIPLASGDVVNIRFFGKVQSGTHTMTSTTSNDTAWGVFTTAF